MRSSNPEVNVRAACWCLLSAITVCPRCRTPTPVCAIAVPPGHATRNPDDPPDDAPDDAPDEEVPAPHWSEAGHCALLFQIEHLSAAVREGLARLAPRLSLHPVGAEGCCLANHCANCGAAFDDQELFCEPGDAFVPVDPVSAARIDIQIVDGPFEACAGGYAPDPAFLEIRREG